MLQRPVVGLAEEGLEDRRDHLAMVERTQRLADVMQQRHDDVFLVTAIAQGPGSGLEAVRPPIDGVGLVAPEVVEEAQQQSGQGCEVLLVDMTQDREILRGHVIHTVELHALVSHARRLAAPTSTIPYLG